MGQQLERGRMSERDDRLIRELVEACKQAVRRIEQLNSGTEELGPDPTLERLKKVIAKVDGK
jgi:hypothetical protein